MASSSSHRRRRAAIPLAIALVLSAACSSGDDDDTAADGTEADASGGGSGEAITIGYSAWPGWFPWKVAEEQGFFEDAGVDVELQYFDDYIASLDALAAGQIDGNSQTLNDTLVGVSSGSDQVVVVVNDNSAGNDAIIVDESIESVEDLEGKAVGAEPGVVDHFLLLQGLADAGLTEEDVDFQGLPTDQAAATFASGQLDAVGVFAPFTVEALEREGSHVLFDSSDYPGTIPDFLALDRALVDERPEDVQKIVDAWYATMDWIAANPDEATEIMADQAGVSVEEYESFADGTKLFTPDEALEAFTGDADTDLPAMTEQVAEFLPEAGLVDDPPDTADLYDPSFTEDYVEREGA
jgi:NitT/TauT family transport system substrate-binding protein